MLSGPHADLSRFVEAAGQRWHVQQTGSGPVMLLLHGTGASTHSWRGLMPLLSAHYTLLAVDLPGHGSTRALAAGGASTRTASIAGMSSGIAALLRQLNLGVSYCVGHSAGAVVACRMALDGGIAPKAIVAVNGAFVPLAGAAATWFAPIARLMASGSVLPRLFAWSAGNPNNVARMLEATGSHLDAEGIELYTRLVRRPEHVAGALAMMGNWDLVGFERDLRRLRTPLALIVAENDRTIPPSQAEWVKQRVPAAEIYRVPKLGHLAHEEAPALLAQEIARLCAAHG